ncbi:hypothetical protein Pcinc_029640 [Petrolisthes cinctipes]|uniref:Uncharacterized protein n=1 Tax=Petrolisthes cinctipes TaxID=88211 RepID=A0AAE1EZN5_PETCI|nr:hypothetical protein Pcinc_029640 [Petrolisthes cinctipes]
MDVLTCLWGRRGEDTSRGEEEQQQRHPPHLHLVLERTGPSVFPCTMRDLGVMYVSMVTLQAKAKGRKASSKNFSARSQNCLNVSLVVEEEEG